MNTKKRKYTKRSAVWGNSKTAEITTKSLPFTVKLSPNNFEFIKFTADEEFESLSSLVNQCVRFTRQVNEAGLFGKVYGLLEEAMATKPKVGRPKKTTTATATGDRESLKPLV